MINLVSFDSWQSGIEAFLYYKHLAPKSSQGKAQADLMLDAVRVFVLECLLRAS
jgi:hypothetical protein